MSYATVGLTSGFRGRRDELEDRERDARLRDAADERAQQQHDVGMEDTKYDRSRRPVREEAEALALRGARTDVETRERRADIDAELDPLRADDERDELERRPEQRDREERSAERLDEAERLEMEQARRNLSRMSFLAHLEGGSDVARILREGGDPELAMRAFNSRGFGRIEGIEYDKESDRLVIVEDDGDRFEGTLAEFERQQRALAPGPEMTTLRHNEEMGYFDPETNDWVSVHANRSENGEGGSGRGGATSLRGNTQYNQETRFKHISEEIARVMGGRFDPDIGRMVVPEGQSDLYRLLSEAAQFVEQSYPDLYAPAEVASVVREASWDLQTRDQIVRAIDGDRENRRLNDVERQQLAQERWMEQMDDFHDRVQSRLEEVSTRPRRGEQQPTPQPAPRSAGGGGAQVTAGDGAPVTLDNAAPETRPVLVRGLVQQAQVAIQQNVPRDVVVERMRALGMTDEEIRDSGI